MRREFWAPAAVAFLLSCGGSTRPSSPVDAQVESITRPAAIVIVEPEVEAEAKNDAEGFADDALLPCVTTAETDAARYALSTLGSRIDGLDDGPKAPTKPAIDALRALLLTPCFELAAADLPGDELVFDSGLALKTWWSEGGFDALYYYLPGKRQLDYVMSPPSPLNAVFLDGNEASPLAPLLCPSTDKTCGRGEPAGWYLRATRELERRMTNRDADLEKCAAEAKAEGPTSRWGTYRSCRLSRSPRRATLPLGRFRAPADGLFVIATGGHGGHGSCGAMSAYDLGTGTAIHTGCGGSKLEVGRVSVSALREATWMLALSAVASTDHRPPQTIPVPADIAPGRPRDSFSAGGLGFSGWYSTYTPHEWTWLRASKGILTGQLSGEVVHGGASHDANEHAAALLEIVDAGFVPGCAPALAASARGTVDWSRTGRRGYHADEDPPFAFDQPDLLAARQALASAKMPQPCAPLP